MKSSSHARALLKGAGAWSAAVILMSLAFGVFVNIVKLQDAWEHSLKNELILARWTGRPRRSAALRLKARHP